MSKKSCCSTTAIKASGLSCSDVSGNPVKGITLTRLELEIIKEHSATYGHGWILKNGQIVKIKLP